MLNRPVVHPLGPIFWRYRTQRPGAARAAAGGVFLACAAVLATAAWLKPDPSGMGTHQQLGMFPCSLVYITGYPCPTCGMTTAFAHAVRGHVFRAFHAHPGGFVLALVTAVVGAAALSVLLTGKTVGVNWYRVSPGRVVLAIVVVLLGGWLYKIVVGLATGALPVQ